jgi:hypothetical protein
MSQWRALDDGQLRTVVDTLLGADRLLVSVPATAAARELGWKVVKIVPHTVLTTDPGYGVGDAGASLPLDDQDRAIAILVDVTESTVDAGPAAKAFQQDTFAAASQVLTRTYGPPTAREPGEQPEIWWRRETVTLKLRIGWLSVELELDRNEDVDQPEEYL